MPIDAEVVRWRTSEFSPSQLTIKQSYIGGTARVHFGDIDQSTNYFYPQKCEHQCCRNNGTLQHSNRLSTRARDSSSYYVIEWTVKLFAAVGSGVLLAKIMKSRSQKAQDYSSHCSRTLAIDAPQANVYKTAIIDAASTKMVSLFDIFIWPLTQLNRVLNSFGPILTLEQFSLWKVLGAQYLPKFHLRSNYGLKSAAQFGCLLISKPLLSFAILLSIPLIVFVVNIGVDLFSGHLNKTRLDKQLKTVIQLNEVGDLISKAKMLPTLLGALLNIAPALIDQDSSSWSFPRTVRIIATRIKLMSALFLVLGALIMSPLISWRRRSNGRS